MTPEEEKRYAGSIKLARDDRAEQAGLGSLYMGLFIALLGPIALATMGAMEYDPTRMVMWGVIGTAPVGALMGLIHLVRLIRLNRVSAVSVLLLLFTFGAAAATWWLTRSSATGSPV